MNPLRWLRMWQLGVKSLLVHPLRSLLTVLGIFIGVASVIWLVAIGEGISVQAQRQIEDLGATNIIIRSVKPTMIEGEGFPKFGVTREDKEVIEATIPTIERVLPIREIPRRVTYGTKSLDARLVGCTPEYAEVMRLTVNKGHFLTATEMNATDNVCVLAAELAATLFPLTEPIGKRIGVEKSDGRRKPLSSWASCSPAVPWRGSAAHSTRCSSTPTSTCRLRHFGPATATRSSYRGPVRLPAKKCN